MQGEGAVTEESARIMLKRGLRRCEEKEGFVYTRDLRHKVYSLYGFPTVRWSNTVPSLTYKGEKDDRKIMKNNFFYSGIR